MCTRWEGVGVARNPKPLRLICVVVLLAVAACTFQDDPAILALADDQRASPSEAPARADGSLATLTAEVRQLRDRRAQIEDVINELQAEQARIELQLQEVRSRENDLSRAVQSEETRFNELITRLEQLAR